MRTHVFVTMVPAVALFLAPGSRPVAAQDRTPTSASWTVTVTPTLNPLPAGLCGAVQLAIVDAETRDTPRNPAGYRVSLADFDMGVTSPDGKSVVAQSIDERHWLVCTCQGPAAGTVATITASYPAAALSEKSRVADMTVEASANFLTAAAKGQTNPPGCAVPGAPEIVRGPPKTRVPGATPPTGFHLLPSVPIIASLGWDSMPGAVTYTLWRAGGGSPSTERRSVSQAAAKTVGDTIADPRIVYRYTLVAHYADGTSAESPAVEFASPPLVNPSGFTAQHRGLGNLDFRWRPVPGALRYRLDGPGIPNTGFYTKDTITSYPKIPGGPNTWKLTALYQGNYADYANPSLATAVVRVLPPHPTPWLSKNNGPNSAAIFQAPKRMFNFSGFFKDNVDFDIRSSDITCSDAAFRHFVLDSSYNAQEARWLGEDGFACNSTGPAKLAIERIGLQHWVNTYDLPLWGDSAQFGSEAVYGNAVDLGVGRRAQCGVSHDAPPHTITTCYATAHGIVPGQPGFNNLNTITHPGEGIGDDFILSMVISKDLTGATFLVFLRDSVLPYGRLAQKVSLDTEGPKFVPQVCMSCHGGKYNPTTRKVDGASFLPLDPGLLAFASPAHQATQEENIRVINMTIVNSAPTSAVATYIRGLYGNAVAIPGTHAKVDYVPQGWAPQSGFYRSVVKPYCATCHLTAPESWNFASWSNFQDNAALIRAAVCSAHTMPHAELQYKAFWTKDTGPVYTPGLLAATLGFPSCP